MSRKSQLVAPFVTLVSLVIAGLPAESAPASSGPSDSPIAVSQTTNWVVVCYMHGQWATQTFFNYPAAAEAVRYYRSQGILAYIR